MVKIKKLIITAGNYLKRIDFAGEMRLITNEGKIIAITHIKKVMVFKISMDCIFKSTGTVFK